MTTGKPGTKAPHATDTRYIAHGCRCEPCTEAHRVATAPVAKAMNAALRRLREEYPQRFAEILAEEKARHGVRLKPGRPPKVSA